MHGHKNIGLGLVPLVNTWLRLDGSTLLLWRSLGQMMIDWFGFVLAINLFECDRGLVRRSMPECPCRYPSAYVLAPMPMPERPCPSAHADGDLTRIYSLIGVLAEYG
ncbi:unnamed protein product [Cochlearia groenlandica]